MTAPAPASSLASRCDEIVRLIDAALASTASPPRAGRREPREATTR